MKINTKEAITRMMNGERFRKENGYTAFYCEDYPDPFRIRSSRDPMEQSWQLGVYLSHEDWEPVPTPVMRYMSIGELAVKMADNPRMILREKGGRYWSTSIFSSAWYPKIHEYNYLLDDGTIDETQWKECKINE